MDGQDIETTDVLICGCGPTGALLGAYLGQMSVPSVILEKEADITTDPRGIALDEDGIRLLQGAGLYDSIYTEIGTCKSSAAFQLNYMAVGTTLTSGMKRHEQL